MMSKRFREIKSYFRDQGIKANNHDIRRVIHLGDAFKKQYKRTLRRFNQSHLDSASERLEQRGGEGV